MLTFASGADYAYSKGQPPALVGSVLGLRILQTVEPTVKLDVIAMLGFIMRAGIVVNSAILLVEQALTHMREGMAPQEAILESAHNRLRPLFMSASSGGVRRDYRTTTSCCI